MSEMASPGLQLQLSFAFMFLPLSLPFCLLVVPVRWCVTWCRQSLGSAARDWCST